MAEAQKTFSFELVSPERRLISEPARMVSIPGEEGDFGVLPGHSALIATIRPGVIEVVSEEGGKKRLFVSGGFADVTATSCTVLAEEAVNVNDLDQATIEQSIKNLQDDLGLAKDETEKSRIAAGIKLAKARLSAVTGHISV